MPRLDELDDSIVYYWCNTRTAGSLTNRQAQGLHVSTKAEGMTNKFQGQLMGNKLDLARMGHVGPIKKEEKAAVKARLLNSHWFVNWLGGYVAMRKLVSRLDAGGWSVGK